MVLEEFYMPVDKNEIWVVGLWLPARDLNRKTKTVTLLEETEDGLHDFRVGEDLLAQ